MENKWERKFAEYFTASECYLGDASHDIGHFSRVATVAMRIADLESGAIDKCVIIAAAWFHDIVSLPKNHPEARLSSQLAAEKAQEILQEMGFPKDSIGAVRHAIHAHSFSAGIFPETIEAKIIQDSDRMEALGALGIMRTFYVSGRMNREPYHATDPFAKKRALDDKMYGLDHFYCKLFKLPGLLQTIGGRQIALARTQVLHDFVCEVTLELQVGKGAAHSILEACLEAGAIGRSLFDLYDPFAEKRTLQPTTFALDAILEKFSEVGMQEKMPFLLQFVSQLRLELIVTSPLKNSKPFR